MQHTISTNFIRSAFQSPNFKLLFNGEKTHTPALSFTKEIVPYTTDKGFIIELIKSGLPEIYQGDTIKEISSMVDWCLDNGFDSAEKANSVEKSPPLILLALVEQSGATLFYDKYSNARIEINENGKKSVYALSSTKVKRWLSRLYYTHMGKAISDQAFRQAYQLLEAKALFDSPQIDVHLRFASSDGNIIVALCDDNRNVAVVGPDGYEVGTDSSVKFMDSSYTAPLPLPLKGSNNVLGELQDLLGMENSNFHRLLAFLLCAFKPGGPYFCLFVEGEQGSGKSFLCLVVKTLIDPSVVPKLRMPDKEQDLMILAKDNHLLLFDNMSGLNPAMSDALCRLATGGGFATRKLYTDEDSQIFYECRPFVCNGITGIATRPDLLERAIPLNIPSIALGGRKTEGEMLESFEKIQPKVLDFLLNATAVALKNFDHTATPTQFRMADAAKWIQAAEPATGLPKGTLLKALEDGQNEVVLEAISANTVAQALYKIAEAKPYEGTIGNLLVLMKEGLDIVRYDRKFPSNPAHLSHTLKRYGPGLKKAGINVEFGPKTRQGKIIKVWLSDDHVFDA